jgi:ribosome maturation factor RimP
MKRLEELRADISERASAIALEIGVEIVEVKVHAHHHDMSVQVIADRPNGGIAIEECGLLNQKLDKVLFEDLQLGRRYTLEVSSPGLDRPLVTYRDFCRSAGRDLHVYFREPVRGRREIDARLKAVGDRELIFQVEGEEWAVPVERIEKAKQIIM